MNKLVFSFLTLFLLISCKEKTNEDSSNLSTTQIEEGNLDLSRYPQDLQDVFEAHGGLAKWNEMKSLTFRMASDKGDEIHTVDLKSRKTLIETDNYNLGFDGENIWLDQDSTFFQPQRAEFYYNLMFYFYAMPFVIADRGITYSDVTPLEINGINYPGIKVGFDSGIGNSHDDKYILYYNPTNKKMAWLGYTVTYGQEGTSDRMNYISYNKWQEVNELLLPKELTWFALENGKPTIASGPAVRFDKIDIDRSAMNESMYNKPTTGIYVDE